MTASTHQLPQIKRLVSGIAGLDVILKGGFFEGGVYLIMGQPGTGKTILGNQICFNHVAAGGRAVYVTLLAETHARMLVHLQSLKFFTPEPIANTLYYISGYRVLEQSGLNGLLELLRQVVRDQKASLLMIDGLVTAESVAGNDLAFKRFIHELQVYVELIGCTTFLLTQLDQHLPHPEHTMVDGLLELSDQRVGLLAVRELEVRKLRGSDYLRGRHIFEITDDGIVAHPRTESWLAMPSQAAPEDRRKVSVGVPRLDEMLQGGLLTGSTTLLLGAPGSGKTLLGLHYLVAGARANEPSLHYGFYEMPPRLIGKADQVGLQMGSAVRNGLIEVIWQPPIEATLDQHAEKLLAAIQRRKVRRVFLDGLTALEQTTIYPQRMGPFLASLMGELRARDITTVFSAETRLLFGPAVEVPIRGLSSVVENIIFLRYVELRSQLFRLISIMKVRESSHDPAIREFRITDGGIDVAATFESAEAILTGIAHPSASSAAPAGRRTRRGQG